MKIVIVCRTCGSDVEYHKCGKCGSYEGPLSADPNPVWVANPKRGVAMKTAKKIMPAKAELRGNKLTWTKKGGYAGIKQIVALLKKARAAGFVAYDARQYGCPDGSTVGSGTYYRAPNGDLLYVSCSYGVTAADNRYRAEYTMALPDTAPRGKASKADILGDIFYV